MNDHARFPESIAAYSLGTGSDDAAELLEHVADCEPCRALFREMRDVADDLALSADPIAVPAAVTARIMDAVAADRPVVVNAADAPTSRRASARTRRLLALAAMLTVAALGASNVRLAGNLSDARARDRSIAQAVLWLSDPAATKTVLAGNGRGNLTLAVRPDGAALLIGSALEVPAGRALALWLISPDGVPVPGPLFRPSRGTAVVDLHLDLEEITTVAVSVEKQRVPRPTSEPIFQAVLTQPTRV